MQISVINCFSSSKIFSCFFTSFSRPWNQIIESFTEWIMMITLWRMYWLMDQKLIMPSLSLSSLCVVLNWSNRIWSDMLIQLFMILHESRNKINIMTWVVTTVWSYISRHHLSGPGGMSRLHRCSHRHCTAAPSNCWHSAGLRLSPNLIGLSGCCFPMGVLSECYVSGHEKYCIVMKFNVILTSQIPFTQVLNLGYL